MPPCNEPQASAWGMGPVSIKLRFAEIRLAGLSWTFRANSVHKRVWSLIGQWTVHNFPNSLRLYLGGLGGSHTGEWVEETEGYQ